MMTFPKLELLRCYEYVDIFQAGIVKNMMWLYDSGVYSVWYNECI